MSKTGRLGLPYILQAQAQKEVTHNQALNILDVFVNTVVEAIVEDLPATSNDGDIYITERGKLAQYSGGNWTFHQPIDWMEVWLKNKQERMRYNDGDWISSGSTVKATNVKDTSESLQVSQWQEDIKLSGTSTSSTKFLPDHSSVIAVNTWVIEPITGVANFSIGVKGDAGRYGSGISSAKDTTNVGMTNYPTTYYYDTPVIFTAKDGDFTGGVIRLSVQYFKPNGAWPW